MGNYKNEYDVMSYITLLLTDEKERVTFLLRCLNEFFSKIDSCDLTILDYACGPSILFEVSASSKASEIVLADYNKLNIGFLKNWLKDPTINDWSPYFKHVVENLEGRSGEEAAKREQELGKKVKAVVACDLTKSQIIDEGYEGPYDIVINFMCLNNVATNAEEYQVCLNKVTSLVKTNGNFLFTDVTAEKSHGGTYAFGGRNYPYFVVTDEIIVDTLRGSGFSDVSLQHLYYDYLPAGEKITFLAARKTGDIK